MRQFVQKRFGKDNAGMATSYNQLVTKMIKGDEMGCSLDFMTKLETNNFNNIMHDFTTLSQIHVFTDKCG